MFICFLRSLTDDLRTGRILVFHDHCSHCILILIAVVIRHPTAFYILAAIILNTVARHTTLFPVSRNISYGWDAEVFTLSLAVSPD